MAYSKDLISEILFTEKQIQERAYQIAEQINKDYEGKDISLLCTLKGAVPFFTDIIKKITVDCHLDFIKASSYKGKVTYTSGNVELSKITQIDIKNKDIIIVEDIVDTGLTCEKLIEYIKENGCKSVEICTLLDKPSRRINDIKPKYIGFEIPDEFIIGYGLDYNEYYRNLPYIGILAEKYR